MATERKYRVMVCGDDSNPSGSHPSYWAEFFVPDDVTDPAQILERYLRPAVCAAWMGYRKTETMAEAVDAITP